MKEKGKIKGGIHLGEGADKTHRTSTRKKPLISFLTRGTRVLFAALRETSL